MKRHQWTCLLLAAVLCLTAGCAPQTPTQTSSATTAPITEPPVYSYTYRTALTEQPLCWSPMGWATDTELELLRYTTPGLYAVSGGELTPMLAAAAPVDVTTQYAGAEPYSVPKGAVSGYAYTIDLDPRANWSDGTPITASDYLFSLELLLDSTTKYSRAEDFYAHGLQIANAWEYSMQDQVGLVTYRTLADAGYSSIEDAQAAGHTYFYLDMTDFWGLDCGWQPISSTAVFRDDAVAVGQAEDLVTPKYLYETYLTPGASYAAYQTTYVGILDRMVEELDFSQVGLLKTGTYQLTLILDVPLSPEALQSALCTPWLIRFGMDPASYGTSPETTPACGPYLLTQADENGVYLEQNPLWFREGYAATSISGRYFSDEAAMQKAFDQGELDVAPLKDGTLVTPKTYVTRLTCNSSLATLSRRETEGIGKRILSLPDFRQALSLSLDRTALSELSPGSVPTQGLLGTAFRLDHVGGQVYRDTPQGKQALSGLTGDAAALFQSAWDQAESRGWVDDTTTVELELLVYSEDPVYDQAIQRMQDALSLAAVGTDLEDRLKIVKTVNPNYAQAAQQGDFDLIFSTWGGQEWDPWRLLQCCCDEALRLEFGFEPSVEALTLTVQGQAQTRTYRGWYEALVNGKYAGAPLNTRLEVLSGLEKALLEQYCAIPLYQRSRITAVSDRLEPADYPGWETDLANLKFLKPDP